MNLTEFTIGRVVYPTADSTAQYPGHVHGFSLNSCNEVTIVVQYPVNKGLIQGKADTYYYREVHPKFLQFVPVA